MFNECSEENGCITMTENCMHTEHDENCGYAEAVEGTPCNYVCESCADEDNEGQPENETKTCICTDRCTEDAVNEECEVCGVEGADLAVCEGTVSGNNEEQPENETAECTCGTDDDAIHATNCAVYAAPESPVCTCVEKCTEANVWCDVCGFDYTACTGTDEAAAYEDTTSCTHTFEDGVCTACGITGGYCGASTNTGGVESVTWTLKDGTLTISGSGDMADYEENAPWFANRNSVQTVTITGEITRIGKDAFYNCVNLMSISMPDSVKSIGDYAFYECENLESITISDSVSEIGEGVFYNCPSLTSIKLNCKWKSDITQGDGNFYNFRMASSIETVTYTHTIGYSAEGNKLHEGCSNSCGELETITATLSVASDADLSYTGSEIKPTLVMTYPDNWVGEKIVPSTDNCTYSNNTNAGTATCTFTYADGVAVSVDFTIEKATPTFSNAEIPTISGTYGEALSDMNLSTPSNNIAGTWSITEADADSFYPKVDGDTAYEITFTPTDTANYKVYTTDVVPEVEPKELTISVTATGRVYEPNNTTVDITVTLDGIEGSDEVTLNNENALQGTISSADVGTYASVTLPTLTLTGTDAGNYKLSQSSGVVTLTSPVVIDKALNAPNMPGSTLNVSNKYTKIGDVPLPDGWVWQDTDKETALEVDTPETATAVYTGADKDNYVNVTVSITVTRNACDHVAGDVLYTGTGEKAPTCTEDGLGHKECKECGTVMESGIVVKALGHTGGTATCKDKAVCTRCKQPYGSTNTKNHSGGTEVRGAVPATPTTDGYTGDTYCLGVVQR